ncbi:hypothetical protein SAMN05660918_0644 [Flavobacterium terrigena]|uniref:Uncharacterized protein n=1 Tax=Flavobacterium terrigena TaxID=402734 RepID=A0A1H6QNJ9_9FLAO|nr:hypothetical protein SAMN05660918_0644 [Flavobacterium terrigena]
MKFSQFFKDEKFQIEIVFVNIQNYKKNGDKRLVQRNMLFLWEDIKL